MQLKGGPVPVTGPSGPLLGPSVPLTGPSVRFTDPPFRLQEPLSDCLILGRVPLRIQVLAGPQDVSNRAIRITDRMVLNR